MLTRVGALAPLLAKRRGPWRLTQGAAWKQALHLQALALVLVPPLLLTPPLRAVKVALPREVAATEVELGAGVLEVPLAVGRGAGAG